MSAADSAREFAGVLERAKDIPLLKNWVRIDTAEAKRLSQELLDQSEPTSSLRLVAQDAHQAVRHAYQVPLTDQIRMRRDEAADLALRLRSAVGTH